MSDPILQNMYEARQNLHRATMNVEGALDDLYDEQKGSLAYRDAYLRKALKQAQLAVALLQSLISNFEVKK